ncbi:MAG: hypothetical protein ACRDFW_10190, partial [bacterium]
RRRFDFQARSYVRMNARSPSTARLTAVPTGVPSRRYVVSRIVLCRTKGFSSSAADVMRSSQVHADPHPLPVHQLAAEVVADGEPARAGGG